jgi:FkbM family methyltransferase
LVPGIFADLDFSDEVQRATYWQGARFEYPTLSIFEQWLRDGASHFFDIGSNYGFFTFALLSRFPDLHAHAFEPNPETFRHLAAIKDRNHLERMTVWNCGLSDKPGTLALHRGVVDSGHSTFGDHPGLRETTVDQIEVFDFESWQARAGLPLGEPGKWIAKIDVEGFELKVLTGLSSALKARVFRGLAVEINSFTLAFCGSRPEEIYSFMDSMGYEARPKARGGKKEAFSGNEFFALR